VRTTYAESADFYARGRLPYPASLGQVLATAVGSGDRVIDVGCGPGTLTAQIAEHFDEVVGVDQEFSMVRHGRMVLEPMQHVRFVCARAEQLPFGPASFRVAVIGQAFHWFDQEAAARALMWVLQPGGFCVLVYGWTLSGDPALGSSYPLPPYAALTDLLAGRPSPPPAATTTASTARTAPGDESGPMESAGFRAFSTVGIAGGQQVISTMDDLIARCLSRSDGAPHRLGRSFREFSTAATLLLKAVSPTGLFAQQLGDARLDVWVRP
jgi:SAM-dependent methyltransferase